MVIPLGFRVCVAVLCSILLAAWYLSTASAATESSVSKSQAEQAFDSFALKHGGENILGVPISPVLSSNGAEGTFQRYYTNFRLDYWPEFQGTNYVVQPGLIGAQDQSSEKHEKISPFRSEKNVRYFPETGHSVRFGFLNLFESVGGTSLWGYPISEELSSSDRTVQYFQRGGMMYDGTQVTPLALGKSRLLSLNSPWHASTVSTPITSEVQPGGRYKIDVQLTNEGTVTWEHTGPNSTFLSYHWNLLDIGPQPTYFNHRIPLSKDVKPNDTILVTVDIPAPTTAGSYELVWDPVNSGNWFSTIGSTSGKNSVQVGDTTPEIRVAIMELGEANTDDMRATISSNSRYQVRTLGGLVIAHLAADTKISVERSRNKTLLRLPNNKQLMFEEPLVFEGEPGSLMYVYEIQPGYMYRGKFEFRYSPELESAWLINVLPMNDYLAGLIEQGESAPWNSLTASVIAFRSYALKVRSRLRAKNLEPFDIASSTTHTPSYFTRHQFYAGFRRELEGPRLRKAIEATRGQVVTYQGSVIEAVYFSQANGRTINWKQAWGGIGRDWALGVEDNVSAGHKLIGHGVGMPLRSANSLGAQGFSAESILKRYYTGVTLAKAY
tara:strand:+ start:4103 stop:5929 length:1827 start_codon:yes stop_codon:yes gene_type:complete